MSLREIQDIMQRDLAPGEVRFAQSVSVESRIADTAARALIDALKLGAQEKGITLVQGPQILRESFRVNGIQGYRISAFAIGVPSVPTLGEAVQQLEILAEE